MSSQANTLFPVCLFSKFQRASYVIAVRYCIISNNGNRSSETHRKSTWLQVKFVYAHQPLRCQPFDLTLFLLYMAFTDSPYPREQTDCFHHLFLLTVMHTWKKLRLLLCSSESWDKSFRTFTTTNWTNYNNFYTAKKLQTKKDETSSHVAS